MIANLLSSYYLTNKYLFQDLAARNILVDENNVCKIADFGMSLEIKFDDTVESLVSFGSFSIHSLLIFTLREGSLRLNKLFFHRVGKYLFVGLHQKQFNSRNLLQHLMYGPMGLFFGKFFHLGNDLIMNGPTMK